MALRKEPISVAVLAFVQEKYYRGIGLVV